MIYKKSWKYILIIDGLDIYDVCHLYRVKAVREFSDISIGDIGGYVQGYHNLSHKGNCWVYDDSKLLNNAKLSENAKTYGKSIIAKESSISGNIILTESSWITGRSIITGNRILSGVWYQDKVEN